MFSKSFIAALVNLALGIPDWTSTRATCQQNALNAYQAEVERFQSQWNQQAIAAQGFASVAWTPEAAQAYVDAQQAYANQLYNPLATAATTFQTAYGAC